jgi:hypothetical protein
MSIARSALSVAGSAPLASRDGHLPPSAMIERILRNSDAESVSVAWLLSQSPSAAREALMLVLALIAVVPGASLPAGLILMVLAVPMIRNRETVWLPRAVAVRHISVPRLARLADHVLPVLKWQETLFQPAGERLVGLSRPIGAVMIALLSVTLLVPLPFSNVPPAFVIAMIAVSYLEASALLLVVSAVSAVLSLMLTGGVVWAALGAAHAMFS